MMNFLLRTDKEISEIYERQKKTLYRVCFAYMKNHADTEDALQETFYRLIRKRPPFENEEHEKAWLLRTATNLCKNSLRHWWRKRRSLEDYEAPQTNGNVEISDTLSAVMELPEKYKTVIYLYYYEGYNSAEKPGSTWAYPSLAGAKNLKEVKEIILPKLK